MKIRSIETTDASDAMAALTAFYTVFPSTRGPTLGDLRDPIAAANALEADETGMADGSVRAEYGPGGKLVSVWLVSATSGRTLRMLPNGCIECVLNSENAAKQLLAAMGDINVVVWANWNGDMDILGRTGPASSFVEPSPEVALGHTVCGADGCGSIPTTHETTFSADSPARRLLTLMPFDGHKESEKWRLCLAHERAVRAARYGVTLADLAALRDADREKILARAEEIATDFQAPWCGREEQVRETTIAILDALRSPLPNA